MRTSPSQEGENDGARVVPQLAHDPLSLPKGPITRLRAKRFKEALNRLIQHQDEMANIEMSNINSSHTGVALVTLIKVLEDAMDK